MNVLMPGNLAEACALMAEHAGGGPGGPGGAGLVPMAGATDLLVHWPGRTAEHDKSYLDLSGVPELRGIAWRPDALVLGAMVTYWLTLGDERVARGFPLLVEAARQVGSVQIQSRGTWAGNIANGSPAADGVPALMALDARVRLVSAAGERLVGLHEYYTGYRASVKRADELIAAVEVPRRGYDVSIWHKVGPRNAQAITKVGLAMTREAGTGVWRVVANSVAPTVRRCRTVEALLTAGTRVSAPAGFAAAVGKDVSPIDDIRSTAHYRRTVLCRLLYHLLRGHAAGVV